jgi:hypothetical protein
MYEEWMFLLVALGGIPWRPFSSTESSLAIPEQSLYL